MPESSQISQPPPIQHIVFPRKLSDHHCCRLDTVYCAENNLPKSQNRRKTSSPTDLPPSTLHAPDMSSKSTRIDDPPSHPPHPSEKKEKKKKRTNPPSKRSSFKAKRRWRIDKEAKDLEFDETLYLPKFRYHDKDDNSSEKE